MSTATAFSTTVARTFRGLTARAPALLHERPFRRYWTGQTVSFFGDQITFLAIPLAAVLILHADASQMSGLSMAGLLPALLFSLPGGAWADRRGRRRQTMIAADLVRAALVASLPVAYAFDALTLGQLYAVAFGIGTLAVVFDVCNATLFVSLVRPERYVDGNALTNGSRAFSFVAGPSAGGLLVQVLSAPFALVADALSYLVSAASLSRIAPEEPPAAARGKGRLSEGLRFIARSPALRALVAAAATVNFFNFVFHTLVVLYAVGQLGLSAGELGTVLGAGAVGGLIGAAFTGRIVRAIGVGPTIVIGFVGFPAPLILIPLAGGPTPAVLAAFFASEFISGFGLMLLDIGSGALQSALIPNPLRSRVSGAFRTVNYGVRPLGALVAGLLAGAVGLRPTLWIATVGGVLSVLWLLPSPIPRLRELPPQEGREPEPAEERAAEGGPAGGTRRETEGGTPGEDPGEGAAKRGPGHGHGHDSDQGRNRGRDAGAAQPESAGAKR